MIDKSQLAALGEEMAEQQAPLCMAKQIEQLRDQLQHATRQCWVMAELLRDLRPDIELHLYNSTVMKSEKGVVRCNKRIERIDALLAGQMPVMAEPNKPRITGINGGVDDGGFSVKFPDGLLGEPKIHFQSLCIDGDGVSAAHICAMLAAANWLIDKADWYRKGGTVIHNSCAKFFTDQNPGNQP